MLAVANLTYHALWRAGVDQLRSAGVAEADISAEALLRQRARLTRAAWLRRWQEAAPAELARDFEQGLARLALGEPLAYVTGEREFYGMSFAVDRRVLIPRPETETLVEVGLRLWRNVAREWPSAARVADIGVGSGCVAIAFARHAPTASVVGVDISRDALAVATANCLRHSVSDRVALVASDGLAPIGACPALTLANLPYVPDGRLASLACQIRDWEPRGALVGGVDGLDHYRRLVDQWRDRWRAATGPVALAIEVGSDQVDATMRLVVERAPVADVTWRPDAAGQPRVVVATLGWSTAAALV